MLSHPPAPPVNPTLVQDTVCATSDAAPVTGFGHLPLSFIPNQGQTDAAVRFHGHALGGNVFFAANEVVFSLPTPTKIQSAKPTPPTPIDRLRTPQPSTPPTVLRVQF